MSKKTRNYIWEVSDNNGWIHPRCPVTGDVVFSNVKSFRTLRAAYKFALQISKVSGSNVELHLLKGRGKRSPKYDKGRWVLKTWEFSYSPKSPSDEQIHHYYKITP